MRFINRSVFLTASSSKPGALAIHDFSENGLTAWEFGEFNSHRRNLDAKFLVAWVASCEVLETARLNLLQWPRIEAVLRRIL